MRFYLVNQGPGEPLEEVNTCHGKGKGHPCVGRGGMNGPMTGPASDNAAPPLKGRSDLRKRMQDFDLKQPAGFRKPPGMGRVSNPQTYAQRQAMRNERIRRARARRPGKRSKG